MDNWFLVEFISKMLNNVPGSDSSAVTLNLALANVSSVCPPSSLPSVVTEVKNMPLFKFRNRIWSVFHCIGPPLMIGLVSIDHTDLESNTSFIGNRIISPYSWKKSISGSWRSFAMILLAPSSSSSSSSSGTSSCL